MEARHVSLYDLFLCDFSLPSKHIVTGSIVNYEVISNNKNADIPKVFNLIENSYYQESGLVVTSLTFR